MPIKKAVKKTNLSTVVKETAMSESTDTSSPANRLKQPKVFIPLIIVILIVIAFFLKGLFIVALVNGQPITRLSVIRELEKQGGRQTISSLVNQALILQEAKKKNVVVSQKEIDDSVKEVEDSLKTQGQNLDTALAAQGLTRGDFLMQLKLRNLVEKLLEQQIKVTDQEISDYIEENKETLPTDVSEDEMKKGIREQLEQQKMATKSQEWIENLNKNAKINYFVNY